jgi:proteic killer suppression protein
MEIVFTQRYLEELYLHGVTYKKKHSFQPEIIKSYIETINMLRYTEKVEYLYRIPSLHYKVLVGNKKGISSVRINNKYRIEFLVMKEDEHNTTLYITELSNHYK